MICGFSNLKIEPQYQPARPGDVRASAAGLANAVSDLGFSPEFSFENGLHITASEKTTRIALLVLGIFIFAHSLPQLLQISIDVWLYYTNIDDIPKEVRKVQQRWTYLIGPIIKLIISAVLIIGPDKIIGFMARHDQTFKRLKSSNEADEADVKETGDLP